MEVRRAVLAALALATAGAARFATAGDGEEAARLHPWMVAAAGLLVLVAALLAPFRRTRRLAAAMIVAGACLLPVYTLAVASLHAVGAVRWPGGVRVQQPAVRRHARAGGRVLRR